jgi:hypothetical protein
VVSDLHRRDLFAALEAQLGRAPAVTMMELLPPVGWADVARRSDLVAVREEMSELRADPKGEMAELRRELAQVRAEINGLVPRFLLGSVPVMFGTAGLVLAAAKLV